MIGLLGLDPAFALDAVRPPGPLAAPVVELEGPRLQSVPRPPASIPNVPRAPVMTPVVTAAPIAPVAPPAITAPALAPVVAPLTPFEAFRSGTQALRAGEKAKAVTSLEYAANQGMPAAQWKLGRMYAEGDGVAQSDVRAFEYFSRIANAHADDNPGTSQARFVASAFVSLGHYYREGIPGSEVKADPARARQMYAYAASYFGDADAQYHLGRLYLDGNGATKDPRQAARWLHSAANKGQHQAQAVLGAMLFKGKDVPRQAARGLAWLTIARDSAGPDERWIADLYDAAVRQASEDERAMSVQFLNEWVRGGRRD